MATEAAGPRPASAFGEVLRRYRTAAALSQEELAERAGLSLRGLSDLERGARKAPYLETVSQAADGLQVGRLARSPLQVANGTQTQPRPLG